MTPSLGAAEFFALEAGEYLERLGTQIAKPDGPAPDEFMRFSRALRGSALMAKQSDIAHAAAGLESVARQYREGTLKWGPAVREVTGQAIEDLKLLVRAAGNWAEEHRSRAHRVGQALEEVGGIPAAFSTPQPDASREAGPLALSTGVRAFVAREGALIASALDRAANALRVEARAKDPVNTVIRRLQSLRGLAELGELPPLPEILDGIELACTELDRAYAPPPGIADVFDAAARAVTRISRDVAGTGRTASESEEGRRFADLLLRAFVAEEDVVPIATLAPEDGEPCVVERGTGRASGRGESLSAMEVTGHADHLLAIAHELGTAGSNIERELRLFSVFGSLRALSQTSSAAFGGALRDFGAAARSHIARGRAGATLDAFAAVLDEAGHLLRDHHEGVPDAAQLERLAALTSRLATLEPTAPPAAPPGEIVPISALAPDTEEDVPGPAEDVPAMRSDLATSFVTFARLMQQTPGVEPSLEAFLDRPTARPSSSAVGEEVVPISTLLYTGPGALDRATLVREQIQGLLAKNDAWESVKPLVEELLDLVPLARGVAS